MSKEKTICATDICECGHYRSGHNIDGCFVKPLGRDGCTCNKFAPQEKSE